MKLNQKIIRDFSRATATYDEYAVLQRKVADKLFRSCNTGCWLPASEHTISNLSSKTLDIGCGTGYFHELLRKNKIYFPLVQLDISHEMCKVASSYASPPEYGGTYTCTADMHSLPFADNSFAKIFSSMTMQWASDLKQMLSESRRVLQEKGKFSFSIVGDGSLFELKETFLTEGKEPSVHKFIKKEDLSLKLHEAGFSIDKIYNETITMFYKDIYSMLLSIKAVGASYKGNNSVGIKGKSYFAKLEEAYRNKFEKDEGLPLSWDIIYVKATNE